MRTIAIALLRRDDDGKVTSKQRGRWNNAVSGQLLAVGGRAGFSDALAAVVGQDETGQSPI